jgi:hypothetical protein
LIDAQIKAFGGIIFIGDGLKRSYSLTATANITAPRHELRVRSTPSATKSMTPSNIPSPTPTISPTGSISVTPIQSQTPSESLSVSASATPSISLLEKSALLPEIGTALPQSQENGNPFVE